jgi:hypothetical protein
MTQTTKDILTALRKQDYHTANEGFAHVMQTKLSERLAVEKRTVANQSVNEDSNRNKHDMNLWGKCPQCGSSYAKKLTKGTCVDCGNKLPVINEADSMGNEHLCQQCGKDMGNEWILGAVCGKCVRKNHAQATGGRVKGGRVVYGK